MPKNYARRITIVATTVCGLAVALSVPLLALQGDEASHEGSKAADAAPAQGRTTEAILDDVRNHIRAELQRTKADTDDAVGGTTVAYRSRAERRGKSESRTSSNVMERTAKLPCVDKVRYVRGQGRSCRVQGGAWKVSLPDGGAVLTHGGDPVPIDEPGAAASKSTLERHADRGARSISASEDTPSPSFTSGTVADIECASAGDNAYRVVYVHPTDKPSRFSPALVAEMRQRLYNASAFMDFEAQSVDPTRHIRMKVRCDQDGLPEVHEVALSKSEAAYDFSSVINDLYDSNAGLYYNSLDHVLTFVDAAGPPGVSGMAVLGQDNSQDADNDSNGGAFHAQVYLTGGGWSWSTTLHEMAHNMGAVQWTAPNSSKKGGHCRDGADIMCYDDGGLPYNGSVCTDRTYFDCNHDDFFNPLPADDSYLATHRNLAARHNSHVSIIGTSDTTAPTASFSRPAAAGALVNSVTVAATDNVSVEYVELTIDGQVFRDFMPPFTFSAPNHSMPQGLHTIDAMAFDTSGNVSPVDTASGVIDTIAPALPAAIAPGHVLGTDQNNYITSRTALNAHWSAIQDPSTTEYSWCLRPTVNECFDGTARQTEWSTGEFVVDDAAGMVKLTATGLDVTEDNGLTTYWLCVDTRDGAGNGHTEYERACSQRLRVDDMAPPAPSVTGSGAPRRDVKQVDVTWARSIDLGGAGLSHYEVCFATSPDCSTGVVHSYGKEYVHNTLTLPMTGLIDGETYYGCARAVDYAGNRSPRECTGGQRLDLNAPTAPTGVIDGIGTDLAWWTQQGTVSTSWAPTSTDSSSGVATYHWCMANAAGSCLFGAAGLSDIGVAYDSTIGTAARTGMSLTQGETYRVCVQAVDGVGRTSAIVCSDGARVDTQAPFAPFAARDGSGPTDAVWQAQGASISSNWDASLPDTVSGIADYSFCVTTDSSCASGVLQTWTAVGTALTGTASGLTLASGASARTCVRVTDVAGNTSTTRCTDGVSVDLDAPVAPTASSPADGELTDLRPQLVWAEGDDLTSGIARYDVSIDGVVVDSLASSETTWRGPSLSEGTHTWAVAAVDRAGNATSSGTQTFMVNEAAPTTPVLSAPASAAVSDSATPALTWFASSDTSGIASYRVTLDGAEVTLPGTGTSFTPATPLAEGSHVWAVLAVDAHGRSSTVSPTRTFVVDTAAPTAAVPTTPINDAITLDTPLLQWTAATDATSGVASHVLEVDGNEVGTVSGSTSAWNAPSLTEGAHTWRVIAVDRAGHRTGSTTASFSVDLSPPSAPGLVSPVENAVMADARPTLSWSPASDSGSDIASYRVSFAGAQPVLPANATSYRPASPLADGSYTWTVYAYDAAGRSSAVPAARVLTIDTMGPNAAQITSSHSGWQTNSQVGLAWSSGSDSGSGISRYALAVNGGTPTDYAADVRAADITLPDGEHTLTLTTWDTAGNQASSTRRVDIDTTAPTFALGAPAADATGLGSMVTFSWSGSDPLSGAPPNGYVYYSLYVDAFAAINFTTPTTSFDLPFTLGAGAHTWRMTARDMAGNTVTSPTRTFTVGTPGGDDGDDGGGGDDVPTGQPTINYPNSGAALNSTQPTFYWLAGSGATTYTVRIDDGDVTGTTTGTQWTPPSVLSQGTHTWQVTATGPNGSAASATVTFTVDTLVDAPAVITAPTDGSSSTDPWVRVSWNAAQDGGGISDYVVEVDGNPAVSVDGSQRSAQLWSPLGIGQYVIKVVAIDTLGNQRSSLPVALTILAPAGSDDGGGSAGGGTTTPPAPFDACSNVPGDQTSAPAGFTARADGTCVPLTPTTVPPPRVRIDGSTIADKIIGNALANIINGFGGNDTIDGGAGNDTVRGGAGNDKALGGIGNDKVYGDDGNDIVRGGAGNDTVTGGKGKDKLFGDAGNDIIDAKDGKPGDVVDGGAGKDVCKVDRGDKTKGCEKVVSR